MSIDRARELRSEAIRLINEANETMERSQAILGQSKALEHTLKASSSGHNQNGERKLGYQKVANSADDHSKKAKNSSDEHLLRLIANAEHCDHRL